MKMAHNAAVFPPLAITGNFSNAHPPAIMLGVREGVAPYLK